MSVIDRRTGLFGMLIVGSLIGLLVGCGSSGDAGVDAVDLERAIDDGVAYLLAVDDDIDPLHLMAVDYIHRRWGIEELVGARDRAGELVAAGEMRGATLALLGLVDPASPPPAPEDVATAHPTERVVLDALRCVDSDPRDLWQEMRSQVRRDPDGYHATHVALALAIAADQGCTDPDRDAVRAEVVDLLAAPVGDPAAPVDDLLLEQAAMLDLLGAWDVVPGDFGRRVVDAQQDDGGWRYEAGDTSSSWHATVLAVWVLSRALGPGDAAEPIAHPGEREA